MIEERFLSQTAQNLEVGRTLVPGRRYAIAVVGTAVAFSLQYNTPGGYKNIQGYVALTPTDANTVYQVEIPLVLTALRIAFASAPGTYHVYITEIKEQH